MKIRETVSQVMSENEKSFQDIPESRASKLVQLTLQQIAKQVQETDEGRVSIQGLGVFIIKNVEREKDGVKSTVKRVSFRVKGAGADDEGTAAKRARGGRKAREAAEGKDGEQPAAKTAAKTADQAGRAQGRRPQQVRGVSGRSARPAVVAGALEAAVEMAGQQLHQTLRGRSLDPEGCQQLPVRSDDGRVDAVEVFPECVF
jgi:hypothetical protein